MPPISPSEEKEQLLDAHHRLAGKAIALADKACVLADMMCSVALAANKHAYQYVECNLQMPAIEEGLKAAAEAAKACDAVTNLLRVINQG